MASQQTGPTSSSLMATSDDEQAMATDLLNFAEVVERAIEQFKSIVKLYPKSGGTYMYCQNEGDDGVKCSWRHKIHPNGLSKYRRHYRRLHSGQV